VAGVDKSLRPPSRGIVRVQLTLIVVLLATLALYPPASGKMILVPLWPGAANGMLARATRDGATLVGAGPLPLSFVIAGRRAAIAPPMLVHGVLILAAPPAGCGSGAETRA
jgi:hypothetical protein